MTEAFESKASVTSLRIGLFGGTFDPVHYGHLRPALELAEYYDINTLYMVPNHRPQHRSAPRATTQQRIDMLRRALEDVPRLAVDTLEAARDQPTYTVDTLSAVREENPAATLLFFLGVDAFAKFDHWHRWEDILKLANLVVVQRPDSQLSEFASDLIQRQARELGQCIRNGATGVIEQFEVTQLAISATDIRRRVAAEQNIRFLLPDVVREYILEHRLYR